MTVKSAPRTVKFDLETIDPRKRHFMVTEVGSVYRVDSQCVRCNESESLFTTEITHESGIHNRLMSATPSAPLNEVVHARSTAAVRLSDEAPCQDAPICKEKGQWVRDLAVKPGQQTPTVPTAEDRVLPDALISDSAPPGPQYVLRSSTDLPFRLCRVDHS